MTKGLVINFVVIFAFACPIFAGTGATHEVDQAVRILREHVQKQPALSIESLIQAPKWQKLFPKQIRILRFSDPVFRKSLDLAIRSIFLSEEGRDICSVALGVPQNLEDFFGLTPEAARALASRCGIPGVCDLPPYFVHWKI